MSLQSLYNSQGSDWGRAVIAREMSRCGEAPIQERQAQRYQPIHQDHVVCRYDGKSEVFFEFGTGRPCVRTEDGEVRVDTRTKQRYDGGMLW